MKHFLIVVDMQRDFVNGALGTPEAQAMVPTAAEKIQAFDGEIFVTFDTHHSDYLATLEGRRLPVPHCIRESAGWQLDARIERALQGKAYTVIEKNTFGSTQLPQLIAQRAQGEPFTAEFIGLCTDICVISNALLLKAHFPENEISVDASCCAGVSPETHRAALATMACCQIDIHNA